MMLIVNKNKNYYEFIDTSLGKIHARIDLNTGNVYGKTEKTVANTPNGVYEALERVCDNSFVLNYLYLIGNCTNNYYAKNLPNDTRHLLILSLLDRLDSLNLENINNSAYDLLSMSVDDIQFLLKNFKKVVELFTQNPAGTTFASCLLDIETELLRQSYNFKDDINPKAIRVFQRLAVSYPEYTNLTAYYMFNIKLADFMAEYYNSYNSVYRVLDKFYNYCKKLGIEKPEKTKNFMKYYVDIKHAYENEKERIDKEQIAKHYSKHEKALHFETDKYCIVFPTCGNDLIQEGIKQSNCVGNYVHRVTNGNTYVVFVRNKDDINKNLITCEVSTEGRIKQFLLSLNRSVPYNSEYDDFRCAYVKHLSENWVEE